MAAILEMRNITKRFPGVVANDNVNFSVEAGEVHTLLGENGAGKSTLMNILCGLYRPTAGEIYLDGKKVVFSSAREAMNRGIGMVHQHFMLIPTLTVVENCLIGAEYKSPLKLDIAAAKKKINDLAEKYNMHIDPDALVSDLSVGACQRTEIIKALMRGARILILDEPTAVLTPQETEELFHMIRNLTKNGYTVIFISHKLNEVSEISDRITILRQGRTTGTVTNDDYPINELAKLMVGREVKFDVTRQNIDRGPTVLSIKELSLERKDASPLLDHVNFEVHSGEVFGIAGVDGNGQSDLVECLTGLKKVTSGEALYTGEEGAQHDITKLSTREIMAHGVSHVPQDRQGTGLIMPMNLSENMMLQDYYKPEFTRHGLLRWGKVNKYTDENLKEYQVKTPSRYELAQNLSGGNQQKLIVAREVSRKPKLLIAMHPTRGVDVGAIEYIHQRLIDERDKGLAILLVSTELDEVMKLSDRVAVMYEGRLMGIVKPSEVDSTKMGLMMGGTPWEKIATE